MQFKIKKAKDLIKLTSPSPALRTESLCVCYIPCKWNAIYKNELNTFESFQKSVKIKKKNISVDDLFLKDKILANNFRGGRIMCCG